jgi:hypothetical protein
MELCDQDCLQTCNRSCTSKVLVEVLLMKQSERERYSFKLCYVCKEEGGVLFNVAREGEFFA